MSFEAVVMAGGKGTRLRPFTYVFPKPLLPIDGRPILDVVLSILARDGCTKATITVGHLGHLIELYCAGADRWSMDVEYYREPAPLGTVGALAQIAPTPASPFVVMNGDVLTDLSFTDLLADHRAKGADLTIASFNRCVRDELGVLETDSSNRLIAYHEKPEHQYLVSMGIYAFSPAAVSLIPAGEPMDFPDLVQRLLEEGRTIHAYRHDGYWLDLGRHDDFEKANREFPTLQPRLGV